MRILAFVITFLSLTIPSFAQSGNETITITTYYPSPHGVYGILRLYPRSTQPEQEKSFKGDLYYDLGTDDPTNRPEGIYVYNGSNWTLTNLGGASPSAPPGLPGDALVGAIHTQSECTSAGGNVTDTTSSFKQCRFNLPKCPEGWTKYRAWSATLINSGGTCTCYTYSCPGVGERWLDGQGCAPAVDHAWSELATEGCLFTYISFGSPCCSCIVYNIITQVGCY